MKNRTAPFVLTLTLVFFLGVFPSFDDLFPFSSPPSAQEKTAASGNAAARLPREKIDGRSYPKIASWLGKKQEIINLMYLE